ncbi:HNH endonuclease [Specibacter sp. AOP5-B1-6]|uniref:HNH endonuclease n=1 Tax=Specibacter sp. AOP5-B1-6 TaxID=3457653 RepID=UPI00402BA8A6
MAAPDWLHGNTDDAAGRLAEAGAHRPGGAGSPTTDSGRDSRATTGSVRHSTPATTPRPESVGCATWSSQTCDALLGLGTAVLEGCDQFFEPALLAQLDAALAHEYALQAETKADDAASLVEQAIREGRTAQALAHLTGQVATAKSAATKAESRAALATDVITRLGGTATGNGFDAAAVDQISGSALIDVIACLEEAKNAIAATQAHAQTLFVAQQRLSQARAGVSRQRLGAGLAQQVALARRESPHRGRQLSELAEVLVREMPHTMNAFTLGQISEYRAGLVAKETVFLSLENRARVDQLICGDPAAVALLGTRELVAAARKEAYRLEPEAFVERHEKAVGDRYVSLRPAADGMTFLTALIPLKQGVRILATLTRVADSAKAAGDERGKGQVMADALMHRLIRHAPCDEGAGTISDHRGMPTGSDTQPGAGSGAETGAGTGAGTSWTQAAGAIREPWCTSVTEPDIALELVMTDRSLFGSAKDPAVLVGYDPIPAPIARAMVLGDGGGSGFSPRVWLKRLFTHPESNALLAMDSRSRLFPEGMKEFLRLQDQRCQTPYCDAPIREYDHVKAYAAGGLTTIENGQGLCTSCNQAKEAPGWSFERSTGPENVQPSTELSTPTGHHYISTAPPLPGDASGRHPSRRANRRC